MRSDELEHVLGALGRLVLDEVRLVDDHAAEAEVAEPADVPVEHLVVHDDDVGEAVDRVAVAVDHGRRPVRRPQPASRAQLVLTTFGTTDEQRVGVRRLRGEQRLCRLAQPGLVGEQEGAVACGCGGDQLCLVLHQLQPAAAPAGGRCGQRHAGRRPAAGPLERVEQRAEQLPAVQVPGRGLRPGSREVGGEERVGELARDDGLRHDLPLGAGASGETVGSVGGASSGRVTRFRPREHVAAAASGGGGDVGVLGEQREQRGVPGSGLREDLGDPVEPLELLRPASASLLLSSARTRSRSSRTSRATTWNFVRTDGTTRPRWTAVSTSRTVRASTGMMPSLSRLRARCCCRGAGRRAPGWRWPFRATGSSFSSRRACRGGTTRPRAGASFGTVDVERCAPAPVPRQPRLSPADREDSDAPGPTARSRWEPATRWKVELPPRDEGRRSADVRRRRRDPS